MIMIVKTPGSQMGSPAPAEEGGEEVGGGRWESGERSEVQARSTLTSTAPNGTSTHRATNMDAVIVINFNCMCAAWCALCHSEDHSEGHLQNLVRSSSPDRSGPPSWMCNKGTRTWSDYLVNRDDKKFEGLFRGKNCTQIEK